jgi:nitroreductase
MPSRFPSLLDVFQQRKSIRKFISEPINEADIKKIVEAGQRAPTACNLQTYSIVWIRDSKLKEKVFDACAVKGSIRTAPVIFVICADVRRLIRVLEHLNHEHCFKHGYGYLIKLMSIMDASLVAENMTIAAECLGFGSVFVGSALANEGVIKELKLPEGVLPLTLLCVGYPDERPPTRPRWPLPSIFHIDHYRDPSEQEIEDFLEHMNHELQRERYYQKYGNREPSYRYSNHIKLKTAFRRAKEEDVKIIPVMRKMGFLPTKH